MRALVLGPLCLALAACASPPLPATPSPAGTLTGTPTPTSSPSVTLSADQLAPAPPDAVQASLDGQAHLRFVPLTDAQLATVHVTAETAEQTALAIGSQPYGLKGSVFTWTKVGCIFIGWYTAEGLPAHGLAPSAPLPFAAYMVQILAHPVPGLVPNSIDVVVVDAQTGERDTVYGAGIPPDGIMGTTCGVTP